MKTKVWLLIFTVTLLLLSSTACTRPSGAEDKKENPSTTDGATEDLIYSPEKSAVIIYDEGGITEENFKLLTDHLIYKTGRGVVVRDSSSEQSEYEIIVGKTARELSKTAYKYLNRIDLLTETEVRYLIYSDGKSVAIAYDEAFLDVEAAQNEAIAYFISDICTGETLKTQSGILVKEKFCAIERQTELDVVSMNAAWEAAEEKLAEKYGKNLAEDTVQALKNLYSLYTDGAVSWIADLFDPVSGGFYYSNSARNTEGYLPDLESTTQALGIVQQAGMFDRYNQNLKEGMPEWFGERVVNFVKSLQDPYNGYFYHPQWDRAESDKNLARLGRDEQSAIRILNRFEAVPYYDTPSGVAGELEYGVITASCALTGRLNTSKAVSVSKVVAVSSDDSAVPAHLRSEKAFRDYLAGLNQRIIDNDYWVGNQLESQAAQFVARDKVLAERGESYRICDILSEWLTSKQNTETGLWAQPSKNIYDAVNGLLKISSTYSRMGKQVPNAEKGLKSAVEALTSSVTIRHVCDILNPWYAIVTINANINSFEENTETLDEIKRELIENYPAALKATTEKLAILLRNDGSFGYFPDHSADKSQEMPVAVPDTYEGDVNATMISILSIPQHIFAILGIKHIGPYTEADRLSFVSRIEELGAVIKDDIIPQEPIIFDDEPINQKSSSVIQSINSSGSSYVTKDPKNPNSENQVLLIDSHSGGTGSDIVTFNSKTLVHGSCFVFETDMYVSSETQNGDFAQMIMSSSLFMLNISHRNGKVVLTESSSTNSSNAAVYKIGEVANTDEWFNLRVEYYPGDDDTVRIKLFVNDKLLVTTDNYYDGAGDKLKGVGTPGDKYVSAKFLIFTAARGKMYVDNVLLDQTLDVYKSPKKAEDLPLLRGVDGLEGDSVVHSFDDGILPDTMTASGASVGDTVSGKGLVFYSKDNSVIIDAPTRGAGTNAGSASAKIVVPENTPVGARLSVDFLSWGGADELMMSVQLVVNEDSDGKYLTVAEGISGNQLSDVRIPLDKEFDLRVDYFFKKSITAVYVDNILTCATFTSAKNSTAKCFGRVRLKALDAGGFIVDDFVAERAYTPLLSDSAEVVNDYTNNFGEVKLSPSVTVVGKALSFANAESGDSALFPVNVRTEVPSTFTAEFKFSFEKSFAKDGALRITLLDTDKKPILSYDAVGENGLYKIYTVTENGRYSITPIAESEKLETLTLKFSKRLSIAILYLNGVCVATSDVGYSDGSLELEYAFAEVSALDKATDFSLVSCKAESSIKDFVKEKPTVNYRGDILEYETDSSIDLPAAIIGNLALNSSEIKVLEVQKADGYTKALYLGSVLGAADQMMIAPTANPKTPPDIVAFESDILVYSNGEQSVFTIEPMRGSSASAYLLTVTATKGGDVTISGADITETAIAREGEWFKLRLVYTSLGADFNGDGKHDIRFDVYVNDSPKPVATASTPYSNTAIKAYELTNIRFTTAEGSDVEIYLDNTFVGETDSLIPEGKPNTNPDFVFDPEGDGITVGDGNSGDDDGWTSDVPTGGTPGGAGSGSDDNDDNDDESGTGTGSGTGGDGSDNTGGGDNTGTGGNTGNEDTDDIPIRLPNTDPDFEFSEDGEVIGGTASDDEGWV